MGTTFGGNLVDVVNGTVFPGKITVEQGKITSIERTDEAYGTYLLPGFVDAHVHIESSMLAPAEFARIAAVHGTVATVSDPHEIANVMGVDGVHYMIEEARGAALKIFFGAPSCVPATPFETSGALLSSHEVESLLQMDEIRYLAEVMNVPGVLNGDADLVKKIAAARKYAKPIDGHAPGLRGKDLEAYVRSGIVTDHECLSYDEALEKINLGMKILIREGSAARDFDTLIGLAEEHYLQCMFCSDDKHPDDLMNGHINQLVKRAVARGLDPMKVLAMASVIPVLHYGLDVGLLREGNLADFIEIDDLTTFTVLRTWVNGEIVAHDGRPRQTHRPARLVNAFAAAKKDPHDFCLEARGKKIHVIEALDGQLATHHLKEAALMKDGFVIADPQRDILKIAVVNRYQDAPPAVGFIKNIGIKEGALASSVAHDSHNIIVVGVDDAAMCHAVNTIIEHRVLDRMAKTMGSSLRAPFMTLSFMALPVIPALKISDQGLFDGEKFAFMDVFAYR